MENNAELTIGPVEDEDGFLKPLLPTSSKTSVSSFNDLSLENLPPELFLHICSYLRAKFVIKTLSQVCRTFRNLIQDDTFWKVRMRKRWNKKYPAVPVNEREFDWKTACIAREDEWDRWSNHEKSTAYFHMTNGFFASVDAVHLMQDATLLVTGSRDRNMNIVDLKTLDPDDINSGQNCSMSVKMGAHKGWIWSFSSWDNLLASGSWDTYIKFWDIAAGAQEIRAVKGKSAILCCHLEENLLFAGAFDKKVYHVDTRHPAILEEKCYHTKPVLCLNCDDNYILTGSEDKSLVAYDRRAGKVLKTIKMDSYPMCMWMNQEQLWVGDRGGQLNLIDTTDGDFDLVQTYSVGHNSRMSSVIATLGMIITSSSDKMDNKIMVLEPTENPGHIMKLEQPGKPPIAQMDYNNGVLAAANSDVSVGLWVPKPEH